MRTKPVHTDLQKRLTILMILHGISNEELGSRIGVSASAVSNWKSVVDRVPDTTSLVRLADLFGVSVDFLIGRSGAIVFEEEGRTQRFEANWTINCSFEREERD